MDVKYQLPQMYPNLKESTKDKEILGKNKQTNSISTKLGNRAGSMIRKTEEYLQNMVLVGSI